ncbi:MAG: PLP-dependent transferase [Anaerolineae bacterium]|nr:PLP-dependent transferase [Anaerolineae bacterium]
MKETTQILHQGDTPERYHGAVNPPVVHASLFGYKTYQEFLEAQHNRTEQPFYNRDYNPTTRSL